MIKLSSHFFFTLAKVDQSANIFSKYDADDGNSSWPGNCDSSP